MIDKLRLWLSPLEARAVLASMLFLIVAAIAGLTVTTWSNVLEEEVLNGNDVVLVNEKQIATPNDLHAFVDAKQYQPLAMREFRARLLVSLTAFLALAACLAVLTYCLPKVFTSFAYACVFLVVAASIFSIYTLKPSENHIFPIYETLMERVEWFRCVETDETQCETALQDSSGLRFSHVGNTLIVYAILAFTLSVWRLISGLPSKSPQAVTDQRNLDKRKEAISKTNRDITVHLYLASTLLVVSVVALHTYYSWPAAIVTGDTLASGLRGLATVVALVFGSVYTLVIVVVIGPAIYVINRRADELAVEAARLVGGGVSSEVSAKSWSRENGLVATSQQQAFRLLATLGPILAGPILDLFNVGLA